MTRDCVSFLLSYKFPFAGHSSDVLSGFGAVHDQLVHGPDTGYLRHLTGVLLCLCHHTARIYDDNPGTFGVGLKDG